MQTVIALVSGAAGAAIASGVFSIILYKIKRRDEKADKRQNTCSMHTLAIRYIMLYIIRAECERHIERGKITWEDRRMLHKWHDLYHKDLGGNGDADLLMGAVDRLPMITEG